MLSILDIHCVQYHAFRKTRKLGHLLSLMVEEDLGSDKEWGRVAEHTAQVFNCLSGKDGGGISLLGTMNVFETEQ